MGVRPFRPCAYAGCLTLTDARDGRCPAHPKQSWVHRPDAPKRITGRKLQAMRTRLFSHSPLCKVCERKGIVTAATMRDHVIPLAEGGRDDESNEQAICEPCHEEKSAEERKRGIVRWNDSAETKAAVTEAAKPKPRKYVIA